MPETLMKNGEEKMNRAIASLKKELVNIRTGKASPTVLDRITVSYYGAETPLRQLAGVTAQDGQTLLIQPFDKTILGEIEKAILKSDIGVNPNNDGNNIRLSFPPLTEERRKELAKQVKKIGENSKIAVRNIRRDISDDLKKLEKELNLSEDNVKEMQDKIQKLTDKFTARVDDTVVEKEKEVMTV